MIRYWIGTFSVSIFSINKMVASNNNAIKLFSSQCFLGSTNPFLKKVSNEYFDRIRAKQERFELENNSARIIQRMFLRWKARISMRTMKTAVIKIQRVLKTFVFYRRELHLIRIAEKNARVMLYASSAIIIQKTWRGYQSRKNHEHLTQSVRKEYFDRIKSKVRSKNQFIYFIGTRSQSIYRITMEEHQITAFSCKSGRRICRS